ncbi:hypothetical protein EMCRGX_G028894 [Ephydatia muelleri]
MSEADRAQKRRGKYKKYLKSPLFTIPLRNARRHKLSKASHCGQPRRGSDVPDVPDEPVNGIPCRLKGYPVIDVQSNFEHSGDCDVSDELVNAMPPLMRIEDSEDDSDVGSDESYISSDVGRDVGRDVDSAMQEDDVRVICDEVTDAQDLRAPTMQECVPEAVFSAAASSTDCSPCIVNSTKQQLDMRIERQSIWPVMLALTSLPPALRMNVSNLIQAGIWLGPVKPKMEMILQPVLEKLDVYGKKGIAISTDGGDKIMKIYKILVKNDKILVKNDKILTKIPKKFSLGNFRTVKAIGFLCSTLHNTPFLCA